MGLSCEDVRELLPLYAGGEAAENERVAAEAHLALCAGCARELDHYREMRANLASVREEDPPSGTWKAITEGACARLFPRGARRAIALFDEALRFAAVLAVGLAVGVGAHVAARPDAPATAVVRTLPGGGATVTAAPVDHPSFHLNPEPPTRYYAPRVNLDGSYYLPRVEAMPVTGERDF